MKTFILQSLALIGTVLIIVEAASIPAHHPDKVVLLREIISDAKNMSKTLSTDLLMKRVPDPTLKAVKCWVCFFWRAERSLTANHFKHRSLARHLHEYNKLENSTDCVMVKNGTCTLQQLLTDIIECAKNTV